MKLTNEDKARIFGMYLGNACAIKLPSGYSLPLQVDGNVINNYMLYKTTDKDNYVLLLFPLSKITDEHAIEVAKIICRDEWFRYNKKEIGHFSVISEYSSVVYYDDGLFAECHEQRPLSVGGVIIEAYDRLRELGYALPYKEKSLFELGIAIDRTLLK